MTVAELIVKLNSDPSGLEKGFSSAVRSANRFASTMGDVGRTLSIAVTAPLALAGAAAVSAAADFDSLRRGMVAVTGSAAAANVQLERMTDVARLPGLGFREAIQGSIRLQAVGVSATNAERYLRAFGNAVATTGGGKNELDRITVQLGQLSAKGKVLSQDIRPIIEAAPAVGRAMREAFGTVDTEAIQRAGITTAEFLNRLVTQLETLPRVTGGAKNSFENLTDSIYRAKVAIGEALLPAIVPLVEGLANVLEKANTLSPATVRWGIAIAAVAAVAGPLILVLSGLTTVVTALAAAIGVGLLPVIAVGGPIVLALGGLSALWIKNKLDALAAASAADTFKASLIGLGQQELIYSRNRRLMALQSIQAEQTSLQRAGRAFEQKDVARVATPQFRTGFGFGFRTAPAGQMRPTQDMHALSQEAAQAANDIVAVDRALAALNAPKAPVVPPLNVAGAGVDRLAGTLDRVNDELREFLELSRFRGVTLPEQLPQAFAEQVQLVQTLGDRVDRLGDGLNKLGARAPQGAVRMLETLQEELRNVRNQLTATAAEWNKAFQQVSIEGLSNAATRGLAMRMFQLNTSPLATAAPIARDPLVIRGGEDTGRILGDLGANASLAGRAISALQEVARGAAEVLGAALLSTVGRAGEFAGNVVSAFVKLDQSAQKAGSSVIAMGAKALGIGSVLEVAGGFFAALQPIMEAVTAPLRILGEILALLVVPVLRLLFPVFKVVAIVASYLGETIAKVAGAILNAVGGFVKAIGKIINAITPFANPGNPLVKAGEAMQKTADQFKNAAAEMAKKRKELQDLDFDDALENTTKGLNKLTEAVINTVAGFKADRLRFNATSTGTGTGALSPVPPRFDPSGTANNTGDTINVGSGAIQVHVYANEGEDSYAAFKRGLARDAKVNPALRATAATFGVA